MEGGPQDVPEEWKSLKKRERERGKIVVRSTTHATNIQRDITAVSGVNCRSGFVFFLTLEIPKTFFFMIDTLWSLVCAGVFEATFEHEEGSD